MTVISIEDYKPGLPSADDLDAFAAEERIRERNRGKNFFAPFAPESSGSPQAGHPTA